MTSFNSARRGTKARRLSVVALSAIVGALPLFIACSGNEQSTNGAGGAKSAGAPRVETIQHEPCDQSMGRVETLDSNNDGKSDITRVYDKKSGAELCRVVDLNHDGKPDMYEYFDGSGTIRRREYAYDDSGVVNAIEYYEGGKLVRR